MLELIIEDSLYFEPHPDRVYLEDKDIIWIWTSGPEDVYLPGNGGYRNLETNEWFLFNVNTDFKFRNTIIEDGVESVDQSISVPGNASFCVNCSLQRFSNQMHFTALSN